MSATLPQLQLARNVPSPAGPPSPAATVNAMIQRLGSQGHTRAELLQIIAYSCERTIEANAGNQLLNLSWMADVAAEARAQLRNAHR